MAKTTDDIVTSAATSRYMARGGIVGLLEKDIPAGTFVELTPEQAHEFLAKRHGGGVELLEHAMLIPEEELDKLMKKQASGLLCPECERLIPAHLRVRPWPEKRDGQLCVLCAPHNFVTGMPNKAADDMSFRLHEEFTA